MIGKTLSHYQITEKVGEGGMGVVFLANDLSLGRKVALKFLSQELRQDVVSHRRLIHEAKAAAALDHPNICSIHEVAEAEGQDFIVMEYVEGRTLRDRLLDGPLPVNEALQVATEIAEALEEAHERGIVHRDLKPANIMLTRKGHAKVMDFGLAKQIVPEGGVESQEETVTAMTRSGTTVGTLAYMSPEQLRGGSADTRSDVFSFGVLLYEMLTGVHPFKRGTGMDTAVSIMKEAPQPLENLLPGIPPGLTKIVLRALDKDRGLRYSVAAEIAQALEKCRESTKAAPAGVLNLKLLLKRFRSLQVAIPTAVLLILLASLAVWFFNRQAKIRWAERVAIPEIERLLTQSDNKAVLNLALQAERYIPKSQRLAQLWPLVAGSISVITEPPGADVYIKDYSEKEDHWEQLGRSPVANIRHHQGYKHWKIEKEGFESAEGTLLVRAGYPFKLERGLDAVGKIPPEMVRIKGANFRPSLGGLSHLKSVQLEDYLLDRCEVTNKEYKGFVDNGGYKKPEFWKHEFVKDTRRLSWEEAIKEFVDRTGRPGPATWEFGDYLQGQDNYPVTGVSWYEAAAYAQYAGKYLPTIYHWNHASGNYYVDSGYLIPLSNIEGKSLAAVGSFHSLGPFGTYDMAGNAKEWCWNETGVNRFILGGAWNEYQTMFGNADRLPPFSRFGDFGIRCMKSLPGKEPPTESFHALEVIPPPDFSKIMPCSDEVFDIYKRLYAYTKTDLSAKSEFIQEWSEYTSVEKVSFNDAYGERMYAYLFIPRKGKAPFQTVVYFPGSGAWRMKSVVDYGTVRNKEVELFTKNGRAFVFPVFKGTFERATKPVEKETTQYLRDEMIRFYRDMARCLDYLETRAEFDSGKFAYQGLSYGAWTAPLFAALENRFKAAIFLSGGIYSREYLPERYVPERDMMNFAPRVKIPILMQNGRYDYLFPLEATVKGLFNLLGTPAKDKHLRIYETGHSVWLLNEYRKDTFDFLDKYLGPVG